MIQRFQFRGDGGIPLAVVKRMLGGEVLYRDLKEFWMPGTFYLLLGVTKVFGANFFSVRLLIFACFASLFTLLYLIGLRLLCSSWKAAASLLLFVFLLSPLSFYYNHNWLGLIPVSVAVLFLVAQDRDRFNWNTWLVLGLLTGITASFNQWECVALYIASSVLVAGYNSGRWRQKFIWWLGYSITSLVIPLAWCIYFWYQGLLSNFLEATLFFPFRHYHQGNMQQFPSLLWFVLSIFYLVWFGQRLGKNQLLGWPLKVVSVVGLIFHLSSVINVNRGHVIFGFFFAVPLAVHFLTTFLLKVFDFSRFDRYSIHELFKRKEYLGQVCRLIGLVFFVAFLLADFVVHVLPRLRYQIAHANYAVETDQGLLYTDKYYGRNLEEVLAFLDQECEDGEYVYIGPYAPYFYFISSARNPTRYAHLGPEHYSQSILEEVIRDIERKEVNKVVFLPSETVFRDRGDDLLTRYIVESYEPVKVFDIPFQPSRLQDSPDAIWERKN